MKISARILRGLALFVLAPAIPACTDEGDTIINQVVGGGGSAPFVPQVIFTSNPVTTNRYDVFAADFTGADPINLSNLPGGSANPSFLWSPDFTRVAFLSDRDMPAVLELYVVDPTGGTPLKVSGPLAAGGDVTDFAWAPDSSRLAYRADQDVDETFELYTVTPAGTDRTKVSGALVPGGNVEPNLLYLAWAPDSSRIAYVADQDTDDVRELYVVAPTGGGVKVSAPVVALGGNVSILAWSPDSTRLAYNADLAVDQQFEVFSVLPNGTGHVTLSGTLPAFAFVSDFRWAPDGSRLAYTADQDTQGIREIYASLAAGGGNVKISGALPPGGQTAFWAWAPNSTRIAYIADQDTDDVAELYSAPAAGGGTTKLSGPLVPGGDVANFNLRWAPDSSRVAYRADQEIDQKFELYTSLAAGGGNVKVSAPMMDDHDVMDQFYYWSPDSSRIAYQVDEYNPITFVSTHRIRTCLAAGGGDTLISTSFSSQFLWTGDSSRLVFTAQESIQVDIGVFVPGPMQLFSTLADGSQPVRLSGDMTPTAAHTIFSFLPR